MIDIKISEINDNQIDSYLKGNNVEIEIDTNTYNVNLSVNFDRFIQLADEMRNYNNEKTYEALEDECLVLQDKIEKKDEYIEQLEEVIENLRRK